jgi:hypothetical protein
MLKIKLTRLEAEYLRKLVEQDHRKLKNQKPSYLYNAYTTVHSVRRKLTELKENEIKK